MVLKQWIIVCSEPFWPTLPGSGVIKHSAQDRTIHIACVYSKADDPAGALIHHHHNPVRFQRDGLGTEQVETPKTILGMTEGGQPGWSAVSWARLVVCSKNSPDGVFVQAKLESQVDLLGNAGTTVSRVVFRHLYDGFDDFP